MAVWKKVGTDYWKKMSNSKRFGDAVRITKSVDLRWTVRDPFSSVGIKTRTFPNRQSAVKYARAYMKKN